MSPSFHHNLVESGRWATFSIFEQMGNIGSEVDRALHWNEKGDQTSARRAVDRALELLDLTVADRRYRAIPGRLKELTRAREVLCDFFYGENEYGSSAQFLKNYFLAFALASRKDR
ncbi:hypothetical protein HY477_01590 [Candidatus Uhrbacteria bacterium]|nr:hypothetical protein [Candidatus Uhrbacteria bacterium]